MKNFKTSIAALAAVLMLSGAAYSCDCGCQTDAASCTCSAGCKQTNVEAYAHPSLFGSQTFEYSTDDGAYITGGHIAKSKNSIGIRGKKNAAVQSWANGVLNLIKSNYANADMFNPKMPILRSEWAVVLSEAFNVPQNKACTKKYTDIDESYWATGWICGALDTGMMIGYPSKAFKPDQPITKAEVFATIAQIVDATPDADDLALQYNGQTIQYIPNWAKAASAEVLATKLLSNVPDQDKVVTDEYLSKEQVAYLISTLRTDLAYYQTLSLDQNAPSAVKKYTPIAISIKMNDRISARHSNIGDHFTASTTKAVTIDGITFPAKSTVNGRVVEVKRPGLDNNAGWIKVKFVDITNGSTTVKFPKTISEATAENSKSPFFLGRILGAPLTVAGRTLGVVGRTGGTISDTCGNRLEETGDNWSNVFVETLSGHPGSGVKSFGYGVWSVGKGIWDITKTSASGVFGVVYEVGDELLYVILPSLSNNSSLNPNEELVIIY